MNLVRLTSSCSVDPRRVSAVFIQPRSFETGPECVIFSMENGDKFRVEPSYNESIYKMHDSVLEKVKLPGELI